MLSLFYFIFVLSYPCILRNLCIILSLYIELSLYYIVLVYSTLILPDLTLYVTLLTVAEWQHQISGNIAK